MFTFKLFIFYFFYSIILLLRYALHVIQKETLILRLNKLVWFTISAQLNFRSQVNHV